MTDKVLHTDSDDPLYDLYVESVYNDIQASKTRMIHLLNQLEKRGEVEFTTAISEEISNYKILEAARLLSETLERSIYIDTVRFWIAGEPKMKPAKAVAKAVKAVYDVKLSQAVKEKLGQILVVPTPNTITVRLSKGCEGDASEYYHDGSCYWGSYASSRDYIEFNEGGAIRMYNEDGNILSRCWYMPFRREARGLYGIVIFNAYGHESYKLNHLSDQAALCAEVLRVQCQKLEYELSNDDRGFYLNSPIAYLLGSV